MLIRVKRKRDEAPLDCLLVEETEQRSNKKRGDGAGIASLMESLSTAEQEQKAGCANEPANVRHSFKRIGSLSVGAGTISNLRCVFFHVDYFAHSRFFTLADKNTEAKKLIKEIRSRRKFEAAESKKAQSKTESDAKAKMQRRLISTRRARRARYDQHNKARSSTATAGSSSGAGGKEFFCLLDLDASSFQPTSSKKRALDENSVDAACNVSETDKQTIKAANPPLPPNSDQKKAVTAAASVSKPKSRSRILTPIQREMDKSIWHAFRTADFRTIFSLLSQGADVNFQRNESDGTFALLAAAFHCCSLQLPVPMTSVVKSLLARKADPSLQVGAQCYRMLHDFFDLFL